MAAASSSIIRNSADWQRGWSCRHRAIDYLPQFRHAKWNWRCDRGFGPMIESDSLDERGRMLSFRLAFAVSALVLAGCGTTGNSGPATGATNGTVERSEFAAGSAEPTVGAIEGGLLGAD